jgi:hypothetical protein
MSVLKGTPTGLRVRRACPQRVICAHPPTTLTIGAVICLIRDKDTAASMLVTPVTAIITGMLGLFAGSPTNPS